MKIYCMCQITGDVPTQAIDSKGFGPLDNQVCLAPNRFLPMENEWRPVMLERPMEVVKNGIGQKVSTDGRTPPNPWSKTKEETEEDMRQLAINKNHYPNVDLYRCRHCGAVIIVE